MVLRLFLWLLRGRWRRRATLILLVAGVSWWRFGDWNRPPEGVVDVFMVGPGSDDLDLPEPSFAADFHALEPSAQLDFAREYRSFWEERLEAAYDAARERRNYIEVPLAEGGGTALPPDIPVGALTRTIVDPSQASYNPPRAWVLVLTPKGEPELFQQQEDLNWLLAQIEPGALDALEASTGSEQAP